MGRKQASVRRKSVRRHLGVVRRNRTLKGGVRGQTFRPGSTVLNNSCQVDIAIDHNDVQTFKQLGQNVINNRVISYFLKQNKQIESSKFEVYLGKDGIQNFIRFNTTALDLCLGIHKMSKDIFLNGSPDYATTHPAGETLYSVLDAPYGRLSRQPISGSIYQNATRVNSIYANNDPTSSEPIYGNTSNNPTLYGNVAQVRPNAETNYGNVTPSGNSAAIYEVPRSATKKTNRNQYK